jgi:hypothetical protein
MAPPEVTGFVEALRSYVTRAKIPGGGEALDGSPTSLAFVDHYLALTAAAPVKDEVLALVAPALGAYLGEVAIARFGGRWVIEPGAEPSEWRVELEPVELRFYPAGMAAEALRQGEVEGYDAGFATRAEWTGRLEEALAAMPPVDEQYYYSFTGRLETLEHAVDVLVELERQKRETQN